jgi:nucleoside-diphosphate-sugar epimerase
MAERLRARRSIVVGCGDNALPLVYVADVLQALLLALDREHAVGRIYNVAADRPLTQLQFLEAIAHDVGAPRPRVRVPYRLLYAAGYAAERLAALEGSGRRPPITRLGVAFQGNDSRFAIDKARRELGYAPRVTVRDGIREAAAWYLERTDRPSRGRSAASRCTEEVAG